ncbi:MAG: hypothetical protein ACREN8_10255, partial [Candidatus Dormibacteraceae bacterium]
AGAELTADNVEPTRVGGEGTPFLIFEGNPLQGTQRASHAMSASHLLAPDDLTPSALVLVPMNFNFAPQLHPGDQIDVYLESDGQASQVGRNLVVESPSSVWVPVADEPSWMVLQAEKANLSAVRSGGAGIPLANPVNLATAVSELTASAAK